MATIDHDKTAGIETDMPSGTMTLAEAIVAAYPDGDEVEY